MVIVNITSLMTLGGKLVKISCPVMGMLDHFEYRDIYEIPITEVMSECSYWADIYCKESSGILNEFLSIIKSLRVEV